MKAVHLELLEKRFPAFIFVSFSSYWRSKMLSLSTFQKDAFCSIFSSLLLFDRFFKNLTIFPYSQPSLVNISRNWEYGIYGILWNFAPKIPQKMLWLSKEKRLDLQIFRIFSSQWVVSMVTILRNLKVLTLNSFHDQGRLSLLSFQGR